MSRSCRHRLIQVGAFLISGVMLILIPASPLHAFDLENGEVLSLPQDSAQTVMTLDGSDFNLYDYMQQHQSIQTPDDYSQYVQDVDGSLEPIGQELLQVETDCKGDAIDLIPYYKEPDDIWEQRKDPSTGKVFDPEEPLLIRFSHPVDGDLINEKHLIRIEGLVPHTGGQDYDCTDPPAGAGLLPHRIEYTVSNYMGIRDSLIIRHPEDPFKAGCKYSLDFAFEPMNDAGQCVDFHSRHRQLWIASEGTRFSRETMNVRYDRDEMKVINGEVFLPVKSFDMKPGITLTPDEMWLRYKNQLGLRDYRDKMILLPGYPKGSLATFGIEYSYYQQEYLGVPVDGGSFLVRTNYDGYLVSVDGSIKHNINMDTEPLISASEAKANALFQVPAEVYGWEVKSSLQEPEGRLMIVFPDGEDDPRLVWRFEIDTAVPFDSFVVDIAADDESGGVVSNYSSAFRQTDPGVDFVEDYDALIAELLENGTDVVSEAHILYPDSVRSDFYARKITSPDNYYFLLTNRWFLFQTLFEHDGTLSLLFNQDNVFDEPAEKVGASVHWAVLAILEYLNRMGAIPDAATSSADTADHGVSLSAYITSNMKRFAEEPGAPTLGLEGSTFAMAKKIATTNDYELLFKLAGDTFKDAVAPDVVAHEFCHILLHMGVGDYSRIGRTASIVEGICDTFAALMEFGIREGAGDWCHGGEIRHDGKCVRNIAQPWDSVQSYPSTLEGPAYDAILASCLGRDPTRCGVHTLSTIVSHAFYLMAVGGSGENELGCSYNVRALSPNNPQESREKLLKIIWSLMQGNLPQGAYYSQLREETINAAKRIFTSEAGQLGPEVDTVSDAWEAVGVGGPEAIVTYQPYENQRNVNPWPTQISLFVPEEEINKKWQIKVGNYGVGFADVQTKAAQTEIEIDDNGRQFLSADFELEAQTSYIWSFRQSDDAEAPWSACEPTQYFITGSTQPMPISPQGSGPDGADGYPINGTTFSWEEVPGATRYSMTVTTNPHITCEMLEDALQVDPTHFVDPNIAPSAVPYTLPMMLLPETDYYWAVRAYREVDGVERIGDCYLADKKAQFKTGDLTAPQLNVPANDTESYYTDNVTFGWNAVLGASYYEIEIRDVTGGTVRKFDTSATPGVAQMTIRTSDIDQIGGTDNRQIRTFRWYVHAVAQGGQGNIVSGPDSETRYLIIKYPKIEIQEPRDAHQYTTDGSHKIAVWLGEWPGGYDALLQGGTSASNVHTLLQKTIATPGNKVHEIDVPTEWGHIYLFEYQPKPRSSSVANIPLPEVGAWFEIPSEPEEEPEEEPTTTATQDCDPPPAATVTSLQQYSSVQMTPGTGTQSANGSISFSWNAVSGADKYKVIITDGYNLSLDVDSQDNITGTSSAPFQLTHYYPYYVSVRSINNCGVGGHDGKAVGFWLYP